MRRTGRHPRGAAGDPRPRAGAAPARHPRAVRRRPRGPGVPHGMTVIPISCQSEGAVEVYVEPVVPTVQLTVVGRSPMAHTLADLAAALGLATPRSSTPTTSPATGSTPARSSWSPPRATVTRRRSSGPCRPSPAFVGLVASRKRGEAVLGYLADRGVPRDLLDRVRVPVGLDLGHTAHREIAVSILAELVQLRAAGALGPAASTRAARTGCAARRDRHGDRPGVRDDRERRRRQPPARARRRRRTTSAASAATTGSRRIPRAYLSTDSLGQEA